MRPLKGRRVFGLLFFLIGFGALVAALVFYLSARHFVLSAERADGTIVDVGPQEIPESATPRERRVNTRMRMRYAPVFVFNDTSGMSHTVQSKVAWSRATYRLGDVVPVLYSPHNPTNAKIDTPAVLWGLPRLLAIAGVIFAPLGLLMWRNARVPRVK